MINRSALLVVMSMAFIGCSTKPEAPKGNAAPAFKPGPSIEAKQVAAQEDSMHVVEILFPKTTTDLTAAHKGEIEKILASAKTAGTVQTVRVITWADAEYPSVHTKKLSKNERELVDKRNGAIKNFVESKASGVDVKLYSMAERPSALKEFVTTTDSRLKRSLEIAGIPNTDTSVKSPSKASHSIIIVELK